MLNRVGEADCLGLIICDATEAYADRRYVRVNEGFLDLSGWYLDQLIGRALYDVGILAPAAEEDKVNALLEDGETIARWQPNCRCKIATWSSCFLQAVLPQCRTTSLA